MKTLVGLVAAIVAIVTGAWLAAADPLGDLNGFWSGSGSVQLTGGSTERVKCQVFYKSGEGSTQIRQTMRCASTDYTINSLAELRVRGNQVTGSWEERTYSAKGEVTGRYSSDGLVLSIQGANFSAAMNVSLSSCKQNISITPRGLDVTRVTIVLAKC
jgi:hypothetical protein